MQKGWLEDAYPLFFQCPWWEPWVTQLAAQLAPNGEAQLLKEIKEAEASSDWTLARATYQKLGKIKGMQGEALYGEAMAAFQQGDSTAAEAISKTVDQNDAEQARDDHDDHDRDGGHHRDPAGEADEPC